MTPEALAAALETVRKWAATTDQNADAKGVLIRWLAENAGRLQVVKPLEWECFFPADPDAQHFAKTIFGYYRATSYEWSVDGKSAKCGTLNAAKASAESHYAERLAAAISPAFPAKEGEK